MKAFIDYILQFGNLNQQQIDFILKRANELTLRKEEYFSEAGKIPRQVGFIVAGIFRVCFYNNKGEEITRYFMDENNMLVDLKSFEANIASSEYVQAVTDCQLLVFSKEDWMEIMDTIVGWDSIVNKIFKKAFIQKYERRGALVEQDATTRYLLFMEKFPGMANRVPLGYLASYLGITQSTLSRIRKSIR
jgi:CRP-like cAMP-binding protein